MCCYFFLVLFLFTLDYYIICDIIATCVRLDGFVIDSTFDTRIGFLEPLNIFFYNTLRLHYFISHTILNVSLTD